MAQSTQVPKQYYGYSLQCTEFVSLLLEADPGTTVSLEVFDDLGTVSVKGETLALQTKAGSGANPVSDSSVELWKTLRNWLDQLNAGAIDIKKTRYELYVNSNKKGKLCELMSAASTPDQVSNIIDEAKKKFLSTRTGKPKPSIGQGLRSQLEVVFSDSNADLLKELILHFNYRAGSGSAYQDLVDKLEKAFIDKDVLTDVLLYALGWVKKRIDEAIEHNIPAIIIVDEFRGVVTTFRNKLKSREYLPSFAGDISEQEIESNKLTNYVRQLQLIEASEDEVYEAITDFLTAKASAVEYALRNLVNEDSFGEFRETLKTLWTNLKKKLDLEADSKDDVHFGQRLANACLSERKMLEGIPVFDRFTPGCFHALADVPELGWHPKYEKLLGSDCL